MPQRQNPDESDPTQGVSRVAMRALSELLPKVSAPPMQREPMEIYLDHLQQAALEIGPGSLDDIVGAMQRAEISPAEIAEVYVPHVARRLGAAWVADDLHFAAVTIASARLQNVLRRLAPDWSDAGLGARNGMGTVLVGVPEGVQHTLGAVVLAGQLRRRGFSVHLDIELTQDALGRVLRQRQFRAVMLSSSGAEHLDILRRMVNHSYRESRSTPVIVGGTVLDHVENISSHLQADLLTSDLDKALAYVGQAHTTVQKSGDQA